MHSLKKVTVAVALALSSAAYGAVQEKPSTLGDQQSVAVTIYNENLALIKDLRRVTLEAGRNRLALREVSGRMRPETALLRSISHPGSLSLLEQNFDFDLLTPAKLLEKYVGREVRIVRTHPMTGVETIETATVLAANGGVVMRIEGEDVDAALLRSYYDAWNDREAYATSHVGWGMNTDARPEAMMMYDRSQINGTELRAFGGNFLYSTGANETANRFTACHFDFPMRECTVELDGFKVVERGKLSKEML